MNKMPTRIALLDTSAFRCFGQGTLSAAREAGWKLKTSPWCFFELLCHLDEESNFARAKGNLMKFREVEIIDKPLDRAAAALVDSNVPRVWSSDLCYAALAAIDKAQSYDDLANSVLLDEAGNTRGPLRDVAERVQHMLSEAEKGFQKLMKSMIAVLKTDSHSPRSPERNHQVIMNTVLQSEGLPLPDTPHLDYLIVDPQIATRNSYCFWAYSLLQAIYLHKKDKDTCELNDLEDGQLCAYVSLDEELWVVAEDKKLLERLVEIRELLMAVGLGTRALFKPARPDMLLKEGIS